jgi:hypothetical protein
MAPAASAEQYFEGSPLDRAVYAVLIALGVIVVFRRWSKVRELVKKNGPILLFIAYCGISVSWSDYPDVAFKRWIKSLGDYVMILIVLTEQDRLLAAKKVFARIAFLLLPLSILFIKYYPDLGRGYAAHWDSTQFLVGVSDNKNMLGMVCMVFGFAATWRVLEAFHGPRRLRLTTLAVHGAMVAMAIWLLVMCDSKTSLMCFVLTIGVIAAHTFSKVAQRRVVVHTLVTIVILSAFSVLFLGIGGGALHAIGRDPTLTGRTAIWDVLLNVGVNPIVGTGFESFWLGRRLEYVWTFPIVSGLTEAHDGYLEVYLNLGWIGLGLLASLFWTGYHNILRTLVDDPEWGRLQLGFFIIAIVYDFTEAGIRTSDLVWIGLLLAAVGLPIVRRTRAPLMKPSPPGSAMIMAGVPSSFIENQG